MAFQGIYKEQDANKMNTKKTFPKKNEFRIVRREIRYNTTESKQEITKCEDELNKLGQNGYGIVTVIPIPEEDVVEYILARPKPFFHSKTRNFNK